MENKTELNFIIAEGQEYFDDSIPNIDYWKNRCKRSEKLNRILLRICPEVKGLNIVKDAFADWASYPDLKTRLGVWNDHE